MKALSPVPALPRRETWLMFWLVAFLCLDFCTTDVGLNKGFMELNPLVAFAVRLSGLGGLLVSKFLAVALAGYFAHSGRLLLLQRATVVIGLVVGWNLFWLAAR